MAYNNEWGEQAEQIAADYLIAQGYTVRERRWRSGKAKRREIDIIAQHGVVMVFVEVKARSGRDEDAVDAVDEKKMRMMARAADTYLGMQPHDFEYRFDIIAVEGSPESYTVDHLPDAFLSPLFSL